MSFCYVVMCHTDPTGVLRLVRRIRQLSPSSEVLLRFDDPDFLDAPTIARAGGRRLIGRGRARWGDYSLVDAALESFTAARRLTTCDHVVLISGQDLPIRDLSDWEDDVRAAGVDALLDVAENQPDSHRFRWTVYDPPAALRRDSSLARRALVRAGTVAPSRLQVLAKPGEPRLGVGVRGRTTPPPVTPVKAAQWLTLSARAVDSVVARERTDARARSWFQHTRIPDEWCIPSLLCDDPALRVGVGPTTAKSWSPTSPSPRWVDLDVLAALRTSSAAPFVRKIPADVAPEVLEECDRLARRTRAEVRADVTHPEDRPPLPLIKATTVTLEGAAS